MEDWLWLRKTDLWREKEQNGQCQARREALEGWLRAISLESGLYGASRVLRNWFPANSHQVQLLPWGRVAKAVPENWTWCLQSSL